MYEACERELPRLAGTGEAATTLWAGGICGTITWARRGRTLILTLTLTLT